MKTDRIASIGPKDVKTAGKLKRREDRLAAEQKRRERAHNEMSTHIKSHIDESDAESDVEELSDECPIASTSKTSRILATVLLLLKRDVIQGQLRIYQQTFYQMNALFP